MRPPRSHGNAASSIQTDRIDGAIAPGRRVDFGRVTRAALHRSEVVVLGLLPSGHREGREWIALNPMRPDRSFGSFKVNLETGKWGDFSSGDHGKDLVSLAAFVAGMPQREAAIRLAESLGIDPFE